jgi:hypothetical protein
MMSEYFGILGVGTQCSAEVVIPKNLAGKGHAFTAFKFLATT